MGQVGPQPAPPLGQAPDAVHAHDADHARALDPDDAHERRETEERAPIDATFGTKEGVRTALTARVASGAR